LKDEDVGAEVKATEVMKRKRDHDKGLIAKCREEGLTKSRNWVWPFARDRDREDCSDVTSTRTGALK
jgi:hypothetical protein